MVMDFIKERSNKTTIVEKIIPPDWVSENNASLKAWQYVEEMKYVRAKYIRQHRKITDFMTKKSYQITGAAIAKDLNVSRASLMNTSSYSPYFRNYLDEVNDILRKAKEAKLKNVVENASRGTIRNSKEQLLLANSRLRKKVIQLETQNSEELVTLAFNQLPLPIKRKLGID